jgi:uncharacterized protein YqeY
MAEGPLKQRIEQDVKSALRGGDKPRLGVLRMILAAIKQREVDERKTLGDDEVLAVLDKMVKQRRESITQYEKGGRQDLVQQEAFEIEVVQTYLPTPLSAAEIDQLIEAAVADTDAAGIKDMGKVIGRLKPRMQGRADMGAVSARVKARLGS